MTPGNPDLNAAFLVSTIFMVDTIFAAAQHLLKTVLPGRLRSDPEWRICALRYFNPVGADESGSIGEDPNGIPGSLMPFVCQVAARKRAQLQIFGGDYPTPDGTGVRDYIHVADLASGHVAALERLDNMRGMAAINLGTGRGHSVLEVVQAFQTASGKNIPYSIAWRRPGDVAISYADPARSHRLLKWHAEKSLHDMCADAWRWQQKNPLGYGGRGGDW